MNLLVTGGAGYVGSVLVPLLLSNGHTVRVLDILRRNGDGLLPNCSNRNFEFLHADVCDRHRLSEAVADVDAIVHLAAVSGYPACALEPKSAELTNVTGTQTLFDVRDPSQLVVLASTGSVYGRVVGDRCTEETPADPASLYGRTKLAAEQIALARGNSIALRFATGFGTSNAMRLDLLANRFSYQAVHQHSLLIYGGDARRSFIHVYDMARAIMFALEHQETLVGGTYNIGDETLNLSKTNLARSIYQLVPFELRFAEYDVDADERDYEVSYSRIKSAGFNTSVTIEDGIRDLVNAVRLMPEISVSYPYF